MGIVYIAFWLLGAVLVSSALSQMFPKIPASLIQIVLGVLLVLLPQIHYNTSGIDSEFFLMFFIAPLLYWDSIESDKEMLWKQKKPIINYALGLVILIVLVIGFFTHWLIPSIPLAAAFALGAALGPTDAVAVSTLSKTINFRKDVKNLLQGECLLNDASGVVSFQFAAAAIVTGVFSLFDATTTLIWVFLGGIGLGLGMALLKLGVLYVVRRLGVEDITFHVLLQLLTPFVFYLIAEEVGVSGILAVVAAGIVESLLEPSMIPSVAKLKIVSSSVWTVISFALNGVVFVILGTLLPLSMRRTWASDVNSNESLIFYVLMVTIVLILVRFIWCVFFAWISDKDDHKRFTLTKEDLRNALIITLAGAKGAVTLTICLSIPAIAAGGAYLSSRELIIFLGAGVILVTLLLANFVVPLVAPKKDVSRTLADDTIGRIQVLRNVIYELGHDESLTDKHAVRRVIASYNSRIERIQRTTAYEDESDLSLRERAVGWEAISVNNQIKEGTVTPIVGYGYLLELERKLSRLRHHRRATWFIRNASGWFGFLRRAGLESLSLSKEAREQRREARAEVRRACASYVLEQLDATVPGEEYPAQTITHVRDDYQRAAVMPTSDKTQVKNALVKSDSVEAVQRVGLQYEREQITKAYDEGLISREMARQMRDCVSALEYELSD
ncbi:MAG: sodium:proton antiporter [Coriobacteriales bacterium]|nr:sodium:proton antiporter [Coriobacteriales bacterium]